MKNPLDRDVIARNAITVGTGFTAWKSGTKSGLESASIGVSWGWWYKNMTVSVLLLFVVTCYAWASHEWEYVYIQAVVNTFVCGVTYCKLVIQSGFKQRLWFRLWWPFARLMPYTMRIWLYLALYLPLWVLMWFRCYHYGEAT